jgi:hypothetical protein
MFLATEPDFRGHKKRRSLFVLQGKIKRGNKEGRQNAVEADLRVCP